jgi:hypothetical protein
MTKRTHSFKIDFSDEKVTAFGGLVLAERLASRLGLWSATERHLPRRVGCHYDFASAIKPLAMGLLSGSRGLSAAEEAREDSAFLSLLDAREVPEEAQMGRIAGELGALSESGELDALQMAWVRRCLARAPRRDLLLHGFFPLFGDGTLLEGSRRREGSTYRDGKGWGLLWSTLFAGPLVASQRLAHAHESEETVVRGMLEGVVEGILKPLRFRKNALFLADSLYGDGPTLDEVERLKLKYVVGANGLSEAARTLSDQPEIVWSQGGARPALKWSESGACLCWIQCREWEEKRLLVGRRFKREGEMFWNYSGVMTNLTESDVTHLTEGERSFADAIWLLYDGKAGMENHYKDALEDLGLHHPPSNSHAVNRGFYAVATLAHTLGAAVDLIGGKHEERGSPLRQDGAKRRRPKPRRMRFWRLRRRLFALPARIVSHAKVLHVTLLGLGATLRAEFLRYLLNIARC